MSDSSSSNHKYSKYMWDDQAYSLWTNVSDDREIDSYKCTFVLAMLQENLQHARHVENEEDYISRFLCSDGCRSAGADCGNGGQRKSLSFGKENS